MALVEQAICTIKRLNFQGLGEGETEQGRVLLPYVLPGDVAEFERHAYRGKSETILKDIVEKNAPRQEPVCQYFGACGGCLLQHFVDDDYSQFKIGMLEDALHHNNLETTTLPLITVPFGQRRRANMNAVKKNDQIYLGFHRFHSHQIINLEHCPSLLPELSVVIAPLKKALEVVMEDKEKLVLFITKAASGIDISLEIHNRTFLEEHKRKVLKELALEHNIGRLIFRYRKRIDVIHGEAVPYVVFDGVEVEIDSHCFLQSSDMSDKVLGDMVIKYLTSSSLRSSPSDEAVSSKSDRLPCDPARSLAMTCETPILDLFCGRGTYTIPLSRYGNVDGFECDAKALKALGEAAKKNDLPITLKQRDLFSYPLTSDELTQYRQSIINPPRAGAEAQIREIIKSPIDEICYVSCSPETFARDAKILIDAGYKLVEVTPFDQFYYSPHLEVIGYFRK